MKIKTKLIAVAIAITTALVMLSVVPQYFTHHIIALENGRQLVMQINLDQLNLRRDEKDFIARADTKYVDKFESNFDKIQLHLEQLDEIMLAEGVDAAGQIVQLRQVFSTYRQMFAEVVELKQIIGLDQSSGLRGELRGAIQRAERQAQELNEDKLSLLILQLRRHEKDFLLRQDLNYLTKFDNDAQSLLYLLGQGQYATLTASIIEYQQNFHLLVQSSQQVGLTSYEGVYGTLRDTIHQSETLLAQFSDKLGSDIDAKEQAINTISLAFSVCVALASLVTIVLLGLDISRRLQALEGRMSAIADGEGDLTVKLDESGSDELAAVAASFNRFVLKLKQSFSNIAIATEQLTVMSEQGRGLAAETKIHSQTQLEATQMVIGSIDEMVAAIAGVAENADVTSTEAASALDKSVQGKAVAHSAGMAINELSENIHQAASVVAKLETDSQAIGQMLNVIRDIADQTNLLALNAAIEAARAGEAGRGFSVVADEVRALAMRTQDSTQEIQQVIEKIQRGVTESVSVMETGLVNMDKGIEEVNQSVQSLVEINGAIHSINEQNISIAGAAEQQRNVASDIADSAGQIDTLAAQTTTGAKESALLSRELERLAVELSSMLKGYKLS